MSGCLACMHAYANDCRLPATSANIDTMCASWQVTVLAGHDGDSPRNSFGGSSPYAPPPAMEGMANPRSVPNLPSLGPSAVNIELEK